MRPKAFTNLFSEFIELIERHTDESNRQGMYTELIDLFEEYNSDSQVRDLMGISVSFDEVLLEVHPSAFDEYIEDIEED